MPALSVNGCSQQTFDQLVLDRLLQKVASRTALSSQAFELGEHGFRFVERTVFAHELTGPLA